MDYKNGKIYTIRSHQTDQFYIGSTTQPLSKRFNCQKSRYKRYLLQLDHYISSFEILKHEDAYIELLEEFPCENKEQLCKREGELIRDNNCVNKRIEGSTRQEINKRYNNKLKMKEYQKKYREDNKEKIKEYQKQYRDRNKI